jgi:hypothetical protein
MAKLALSVAVGDYDRTRPLIDGAVRIDGVEPTIMTLTPEETFFRAFRDAPFDVCELSLSSFTVKKVAVALPSSVKLEAAPEGATLSQMLADGAIDALISPRAPSCRDKGHVGWAFDDPTAAAKDYYRRTRIFPIMHLVGVRREIAERHPWVPAAVLKGFTQAKAAALAHLGDTAATKATMPFVDELFHPSTHETVKV